MVRGRFAIRVFSVALRTLALTAALPVASSAQPLAAGKVLVAARGLPDPNFAETVVLITRQGKAGAMGLVLNRPTTLTLAEAVRDWKGISPRRDLVFKGGPVEAGAMFALLRAPAKPADSTHISGDLYLLATLGSLETVLATAPDRLRVFVGYAGWGPGQLERELRGQAWHLLTADSEMLFSEPGSLWHKLIARTEMLQASR